MTKAKYDAKDAGSIVRFARRLKGHTIKELTGEMGPEWSMTVSDSKGGFGKALEELYFQIHPGNDEGVPDFKAAELELKSSPTLLKHERLVAKERLVLSLINYEKLVDEEWEASTFLKKNGNLLIIFYLHEDKVAVINLKVVLTGNWRFPTEDLLIIRSDWERIKAKVKAGKAHEISEGDTLYLKACTKDDRSRIHKTQPGSTSKAKQRAFSLKTTYVDSIIERLRLKDDAQDHKDNVVKDPEDLMEKTFEELVEERFRPYLGKSMMDIARELGIDYRTNAKSYNALVTKRILGVKDKVLEFKRADIVVRSILLEADGGLIQSISFPAFDYNVLAKETDWDASSVKEMFERRFFFVVYQMRPDGAKELRKVMFWTMPYEDLLEVKTVWKETTERIRQGRYDDLPKIRDNRVSHIRPHGRNAQDKIMAPDGSMVTKKCFWLNATYIAEQVGAETSLDHKQSKLPINGKGVGRKEDLRK
jgi:DNA mismatch repair protein MutH